MASGFPRSCCSRPRSRPSSRIGNDGCAPCRRFRRWPGRGRRRCSSSGKDWATTTAPGSSRKLPSSSFANRAGSSQPPSMTCSPCPASGATPPGRSAASPTINRRPCSTGMSPGSSPASSVSGRPCPPKSGCEREPGTLNVQRPTLNAQPTRSLEVGSWTLNVGRSSPQQPPGNARSRNGSGCWPNNSCASPQPNPREDGETARTSTRR